MVQRGIFLDFMTASPRKDATESESRCVPSRPRVLAALLLRAHRARAVAALHGSHAITIICRIRSKMRAMVLNYQAKVDGLASAEAIFAKLDADGEIVPRRHTSVTILQSCAERRCAGCGRSERCCGATRWAGNGKLSRAEFFDGITDVGVTLSDDEYDALWLVLGAPVSLAAALHTRSYPSRLARI